MQNVTRKIRLIIRPAKCGAATIILLLMGCVPKYGKVGEEKCVENCGEVPKRFTNPPKGQWYGISEKYAQEQDAINNAMVDARKRIVDALGIQVNRQLIERLTTKGKTSEILASDVSAVSATEMKANAFIVGTRKHEHYTQKYVRSKGNKIEYCYKVYILVDFLQEEHDNYISQYIASRLREAQRLFQKAEEMEMSHNYASAYNYYGSVLNMTEDIIGITAPPSQAIENMSKIRSLSEEAKNKRKVLERYAEDPVRQDENWGDLDISLWANKVGYNPGDTMRLRLWSTKDCYIYIVDFWGDSSRVMFPTFNKGNRIEANIHYDFAQDFGLGWVAEPPYGREVIKVLASTSQLNLPPTGLRPADFVRRMREIARGSPYAEASRIIEIVRRE